MSAQGEEGEQNGRQWEAFGGSNLPCSPGVEWKEEQRGQWGRVAGGEGLVIQRVLRGGDLQAAKHRRGGRGAQNSAHRDKRPEGPGAPPSSVERGGAAGAVERLGGRGSGDRKGKEAAIRASSENLSVSRAEPERSSVSVFRRKAPSTSPDGGKLLGTSVAQPDCHRGL